MINVMKGLIRHDRQSLIDYCLYLGNKPMLFHADVLNVCGRLCAPLIPFFWPSQHKSLEYWSFVRNKGKRERELWARNIISNENEQLRALDLLKQFDLIAEAGSHFIVPGILPPSKIPLKPVLGVMQCPFWSEIKFNSFPPGAFDGLVVRMIRNYPGSFNFSSVIFFVFGFTKLTKSVYSLKLL